MIHVLAKDFCSEELEQLVSICKSDSGVMGTKLRNAHYELGKKIAQTYQHSFSKDACIIAFLRAAIPFAFGIADILDCTVLLYDSSEKEFFNKNKEMLKNRTVLFIDAVINSGEGMLSAIKESEIPKENIKILTNVLCSKSIEKFTDYDLFTVRISENSFKGEKVKIQQGNRGPDTGDRLFRTM